MPLKAKKINNFKKIFKKNKTADQMDQEVRKYKEQMDRIEKEIQEKQESVINDRWKSTINQLADFLVMKDFNFAVKVAENKNINKGNRFLTYKEQNKIMKNLKKEKLEYLNRTYKKPMIIDANGKKKLDLQATIRMIDELNKKIDILKNRNGREEDKQFQKEIGQIKMRGRKVDIFIEDMNNTSYLIDKHIQQAKQSLERQRSRRRFIVDKRTQMQTDINTRLNNITEPNDDRELNGKYKDTTNYEMYDKIDNHNNFKPKLKQPMRQRIKKLRQKLIKKGNNDFSLQNLTANTKNII